MEFPGDLKRTWRVPVARRPQKRAHSSTIATSVPPYRPVPNPARLMQRSRNIIGPQLRRLRCAAGLSQPAFAAKCQRIGWDIERDTIAKIEGQRRWVSDAELVMLARCFRVSIGELLTLSPASEKQARAVLAS